MGLATAQAKLASLRPSLPLVAGALPKFESVTDTTFLFV